MLDVDTLLEDRHRNVLKAFYSVFKVADSHLQFVLLTGVTKFSQVSVFSGFNQPKDISMDARYETLCGITQEELDSYFVRLQDYWFSSGTPTYLIRLLAHFKENMNELTGKYYRQEEFIDYKADVEQPLPMIYQSGYLTIKDYDMEFNTFLLDFPNNEVKNGFLTAVASSYLKPSEDTGGWIRDVVRTLRTGDTDRLFSLFTSFLSSIPYTMRRKDDERERERYFQYTFYLILRLISVYTVYVEKQQSHGRVDCVLETPQYVYIFEFKLDGTADEALCQIEEKGYAREYASDTRILYKIGASFSSETGTIGEWKTV